MWTQLHRQLRWHRWLQGWRSRSPFRFAGVRPAALRLPLLHALITFTCLGLLPVRPLAMVTALGVGFIGVIYVQSFLTRLARLSLSPFS